eukprot:CAMPEP_0195509648 /NCGR_PEP_ID=MMETSP0794_2-20130614/2526_1 /TAXON_ID=515487 /ORGANISM="Stephanopyxis turris, Strain CCMP 815" /LENGTH=246 /DNA_ID=CAMNT_0040636925 /DNA_START=30 /DNA_END=770 /DNA_ORIENTATION=+
MRINRRLQTRRKLVSFIYFSSLLFAPNAEAAVADDKLENCEELAKQGLCHKDAENMIANCASSCLRYQQGMRKVEIEAVADGEPSFFDLSAKTVHGSTLDFDQFEGYITLVTNGAKQCSEGGTPWTRYLQSLEHLHSVWPYTLEIVVFPFKRPNFGPENYSFCNIYEKELKKKGRKIHVMEEVEINGPSTHPVYKYLKEKFKIEDLDNDTTTFFLIPPDGRTIEVHHFASLSHMKNYIRQHLHHDL